MEENNIPDSQTQTQTQNSQLEWTQQQTLMPIPTIWGRIYPIKESSRTLGLTSGRMVLSHKLEDYYDLTTSEFTVGRALSSDLCLKGDKFPDDILKNISKKHFTLKKDLSDDTCPVYLEDYSYNGTFIKGKKIGNGNRIILENNDEICLTHPLVKVFIFRYLNKSEQEPFPDEVLQKYYVSKTVGSGACGVVKCVYNKITCDKYAMKIVKKRTLGNRKEAEKRNANSSNVMNEANILKKLKHPCIVKTEEVIETSDAVYMIMELMEGGELFDRIKENEKLSERLCKIYFRQMVLAVMYLHNKGITHRDLKPENVLLESREQETVIKLTDFGLSKFVGEESFMKTMCGTPLYLAPEVLIADGKKSYGRQVDVWSLGVILFICLSGYLPFSEDYKDMSLRDQIIKGKYPISKMHWQGVSFPARQLMKSMLKVDPNERITLEQIMHHKWMQDNEVIRIVDGLMRTSEQVNDLLNLSLTSTKEIKEDSLGSFTPKRMLSESCRDADPNPKRRKLSESQNQNSAASKSDDTSLVDDDETVAVIEELDN